MQQRLQTAFACPANEYESHERLSYTLMFKERFEWRGDVTTFKLRVKTRATAETRHGEQSWSEERTVTARFHDLASVSVDEADVTIRCKADQACITIDFCNRTDCHAGERSFHACRAGIADGIATALRQLMKNNR